MAGVTLAGNMDPNFVTLGSQGGYEKHRDKKPFHGKLRAGKIYLTNVTTLCPSHNGME
jgi:hypothetical protein